MPKIIITESGGMGLMEFTRDGKSLRGNEEEMKIILKHLDGWVKTNIYKEPFRCVKGSSQGLSAEGNTIAEACANFIEEVKKTLEADNERHLLPREKHHPGFFADKPIDTAPPKHEEEDNPSQHTKL